MNLKFWGGWFLAIACVCIFLTMGCESGSLGVKTSTVSGRLVNKDNVSVGVPNATVRMVSKEAVGGSGDLKQGYNFLATVTDANGYFLFENVHPDNVIFEFTAPGYRKLVFPSTESTSEEDGSTSESADIESVSVGSGIYVDLANILMEKVSVVLPDKIKVQIDFVDADTKERIDDKISLTVSFDGVDKPANAKIWREYGVEDIMGANEISVNVRDIKNPDGTVIYKPVDTKISGTSNQYVTIEVEPVTYSLTFQFLNVPEYLLSSTINKPIMTFLVENYENGQAPAQSISVTKVDNFSQLHTLNVPSVKNPQQIRIRMHGYYDEVINLNQHMADDAQGSYRIDVDFAFDDGFKVEDLNDNPVTPGDFKGKIGLADNVIRRPIIVNMIGLENNDEASIVTNFPLKASDIQWLPRMGDSPDRGRAENGAITAVLSNCPTYFDMYYTISVFPYKVGSSPYIIPCGDKPVTIGVPGENGSTAISVDVSKMESAATSE